MANSSDSLQGGKGGKNSALSKQLAISLKFHHSETLQRIPLEVAVQVMAEVWESCHPGGLSQLRSGIATAIIPKEQAAQSIRESRYFSD